MLKVGIRLKYILDDNDGVISARKPEIGKHLNNKSEDDPTCASIDDRINESQNEAEFIFETALWSDISGSMQKCISTVETWNSKYGPAIANISQNLVGIY